MRVLELAPKVFVTGQIFQHDLKLIAEQGIRSIVNNRPDGEAMDQPPNEELARAAAELGIEYVYLPVVSGRITPQNIEDFSNVCEKLERPLLVFCRSGARSTALWEMSEAAGMDPGGE
jgi:sulfide:quinone oxidoreductase